ncbi:MAG: ABC transporter permease [Proteobacteria bacterium]|nr:MAG: ABC transporter permease [Pseudomonadota bacterium]
MNRPAPNEAQEPVSRVASRRRAASPIRLGEVGARRWRNFKKNRRAFWSLWLFAALFFGTLPAELVANDRPLLVRFDGDFYFPVFRFYPETAFGGIFETEAEYQEAEVRALIEEKGWMIWPLIPFRYDTVVRDLAAPAPAPPSARNWLGTDDQARDVVARLVYGFRISVLFGLTLALVSSAVGIAAGAVQGYFGGTLDLLFQRFIEIWSSLPTLYLLIILASIVTPGFWWLLGLLLLFSWMSLVGVVRAEFLRTRNFDYVRAARALGATDLSIMVRHILPNAMTAALSFLPFVLSGAITSLTALDFLGFGLPAGSPSLGELLNQGKNNLTAPWLGLSGFVVIGAMLSLLIFIGEGVRDAFDPRKIFAGAPPPEETIVRAGEAA